MFAGSIFVSLIFRAASDDSDTDGLELIPQHTVHPPFLSQYWRMVRGGVSNDNVTSSSISTSGGLGNWDFGASTVITNDRIALNSGWFRNLNKLHSIFTEGWRVILRLHYSGFPEMPLIFTYSTMKGNYPFMWSEIEIIKGERGFASLQVKTGGLNVTHGTGTVPLPPKPQGAEEAEVEVQFLYNRRSEKLVINVGEGGTECLRVGAELDDGYHFGLQSSPPSVPMASSSRWWMQGFYFTSLPHYSFNSREGTSQVGLTSHFTSFKTKKADSMHQFIHSREERDKKKYEHHETEEREQESYMQRMQEAQRRRMEMQERARREAQSRKAQDDPYAADEDDDDDDDEEESDSSRMEAERARIRKRMFDREMGITDSDYEAEYDSGGVIGNAAARRHRRYQQHQVVNPNSAPTKPPQRRPNAPPPQMDSSSIPLPMASQPVPEPQRIDTPVPPAAQKAPLAPPPAQAPTEQATIPPSATTPPPQQPPGYGQPMPPPAPGNAQQYGYPYPGQGQYYAPPYGQAGQQPGYVAGMPHYYGQAPPPQPQYGNPQYGYQQPV